MTEPQRRTITARSEAHTDQAGADTTRKYLEELTEVQFGRLLTKELRRHPEGVSFHDYREEWRRTTDGALYEITAAIGEKQ